MDDDLRKELKAWASDENITHKALNRLLRILKRRHPELPSDARTLMETVRSSSVEILGNGQVLYYGLENMITQLPENISLQLEINVDGLPLFKSSKTEFWPILGCLNNSKPFVIAIYCGNGKPPLDQFVNPFLCEIKRRGVNIAKIVCDSPARAFLKQIKSHSGYSSCDKCDIVGEYSYEKKQVIFIGEGNPRNDEDFRSKKDNDHHKGESPFLSLDIDMVKSFPYDPMHLLHSGVMKRLLSFWESGPRETRLSASMLLNISQRLITFTAYFPKEFVRKPRSLEYLKYFKATEYRSFLLYTGCVALKQICPSNMFHHFLFLHCASFILSDEVLHQDMNDEADQFYHEFVNKCMSIYGKDFYSYNVHALNHLATDSSKFGCLDHFSAFKYENLLKTIKMTLRSGKLPLQQVEKRLSESPQLLNFASHTEIVHKLQHEEGPIIDVSGSQFHKVLIDDFVFACNIRDSHFIDVKKRYYRIFNIVVESSRTFLICKRYSRVSSFYSNPIESLLLGIARISHLCDKLYSIPIRDIYRKCLVLPHDEHLIAFPLSHGFSQRN